MIFSDNSTDSTSNAVLMWTADTSIERRCTAPSKPTQNAIVDSFNGRMSDELLNETMLMSLDHAREKVAVWADHYNTGRFNSPL